MAIYFPDRYALVLHIPKTGGFWIEEAAKRVGLALQHIPSLRDETRADRHCFRVDCELPVDMVYAVVRCPFAWYESWWRYQAARPHNWDEWNWHPTYPLQACRNADFNGFLAAALQREPGFLTRLYEQYIGPLESPKADLIGHTETMVVDFQRFLAAIAWPEPPGVLANIPPQNTGGGRLGQPVWARTYRRQVYETEKKIFEEFYPDESIHPT